MSLLILKLLLTNGCRWTYTFDNPDHRMCRHCYGFGILA